jgi:surfactin synthase thioesterase subunit/acyl carrier protein
LQGATPEERRAELEGLLRARIADALRRDPATIDRRTPLGGLGIDSLIGLEIRNRLEPALGLGLPATLLWQFPDIDALAGYLLERLSPAEGGASDRAGAAAAEGPRPGDPGSTDAPAWVRRPRPTSDARVRLFCLPYAGAGASRFRSWPDWLPPWVEVCPIQLPGREDRIREPAFDTADPLVEALVHALGDHLDRPYALFGCSMGALVCFELARALSARHGAAPLHLFVAASAPPGRPSPIRSDLARLASAEATGPEAVALLRRLGVLSASLLQDEEMLTAVWPTLRADISLVLSYAQRGAAPLETPLSIFGGADDRGVSREDLVAWHALTTGAFQLATIPGGHLFMDTAPKLLLQHIARALEP